MLYVAVEMAAGRAFLLPAEHEERAVYIVQGDVSIDGRKVPAEHMAVLNETGELRISAHTAATLMLLGGEKIDGHRFIWWNFVSSSKQRIEQAKDDWRSQRFAGVPDDTEFIPLPENTL